MSKASRDKQELEKYRKYPASINLGLTVKNGTPWPNQSWVYALDAEKLLSRSVAVFARKEENGKYVNWSTVQPPPDMADQYIMGFVVGPYKIPSPEKVISTEPIAEIRSLSEENQIGDASEENKVERPDKQD